MKKNQQLLKKVCYNISIQANVDVIAFNSLSVFRGLERPWQVEAH